MSAPRLLNRSMQNVLSTQVLSDLQLDKILSGASLSILRKPCEKDEILRRQKLFQSLQSPTYLEAFRNCLLKLKDCEKSMHLWRSAKHPYEKLHLRLRLLRAYTESVSALIHLSDGNPALEKICLHFGSKEKIAFLENLRADLQQAASTLSSTHCFLLSASDKIWITPSSDEIDEYEDIARHAISLGLTIPGPLHTAVTMDSSLADALCGLFTDVIQKVEVLLASYDNLDISDLFDYIPEMEFCLEICALAQKASDLQIPLCFPFISDNPHYTAKGLCDISLLATGKTAIVLNDGYFTMDEPFFFLTGANGGGKTTYLRAVGINLLFFLAGCPVFAREATIHPFGQILTHFPVDERFEGVGRLDEELNRVKNMHVQASGKTAFFLFNETFSGTDEQRGFLLLRETAEMLRKDNRFGLYITHFHPVTELDFPLLSVEVDATNQNQRTFKIIKTRGNGLSYAADILKKYGLDKQSLAERRLRYGNPTSLS